MARKRFGSFGDALTTVRKRYLLVTPVLTSSTNTIIRRGPAFRLRGKRRLLGCRVRPNIVKVAGDPELSRRDGSNAGLNSWN